MARGNKVHLVAVATLLLAALGRPEGKACIAPARKILIFFNIYWCIKCFFTTYLLKQ
jgi:hypothetical protein